MLLRGSQSQTKPLDSYFYKDIPLEKVALKSVGQRSTKITMFLVAFLSFCVVVLYFRSLSNFTLALIWIEQVDRFLTNGLHSKQHELKRAKNSKELQKNNCEMDCPKHSSKRERYPLSGFAFISFCRNTSLIWSFRIPASSHSHGIICILYFFVPLISTPKLTREEAL